MKFRWKLGEILVEYLVKVGFDGSWVEGEWELGWKSDFVMQIGWNSGERQDRQELVKIQVKSHLDLGWKSDLMTDERVVNAR